MIMSGVQDGLMLEFIAENGDGTLDNDEWSLSIGRQEDCDICLVNDTYISRKHARLLRQQQRWSLEDLSSKNGTYIEGDDQDLRITGSVELQPNQLFRIGRTWMRLHDFE